MLTFILESTIKITRTVLYYSIFLSAILTWIPNVNLGSFGEIVYKISEPVVEPCRKLLASVSFLRDLPFDLSPILAMVLVSFLGNILLTLI